MLEAQEEIKSQVQEELGERQREMYLREQLKAIQKELGDDDQSKEITELRDKLNKLELPKEARAEVERELGPADVVAAFAGGFGARTPLLDSSVEEFRAVVESNLTATFLTLKAFAPGMVERRRGAFVTMASNAGRFLDIPLTASYAAAKAAIVMLTRHAAKELGPDGVRVNCVAPATTLTGRVEGLMDEETRADIAALSPLGRLGTPEDSAWATLYLASDAAAYLTGVTLDVAGGRIML
jgi:3-oxoacyl-[acyl-carrier protein] reductase